MIKSIKITNHLDESLTLELTNPYKSGFIVKKIDGLGPVKAQVHVSELSTGDGGVDTSARLESRDITLNLEFLPMPTIEATRRLAYKYFPTKKPVRLLVETDTRVCEIYGRVEENDVDIFSQNEGTQVSIICPDPYFYSAGEDGLKQWMFYGAEPLFEFPFSNESLTENLIELANLTQQTYGTVIYDGDGEPGITIKVHAIGKVEGLKIYNIDTREIISLNDQKLIDLTGQGIEYGDQIIITSDRGNKKITLFRDGESINILNILERPIAWLKLSKGENNFAYTTTYGMSNVQFSIEHRVLYEGV